MENNLKKIKEATEFMIGGFENQVADYEEGSEEYKEAKRFLDQPIEDKVEEIYTEIIRTMEKEVRFVGKEMVKFFIKVVVETN